MLAGVLAEGVTGRELTEQELRAASGGFDDTFRCGNELRFFWVGPRPPIELGGAFFAPDPDGDPAFVDLGLGFSFS